jgi:hypothetical protein
MLIEKFPSVVAYVHVKVTGYDVLTSQNETQIKFPKGIFARLNIPKQFS